MRSSTFVIIAGGVLGAWAWHKAHPPFTSDRLALAGGRFADPRYDGTYVPPADCAKRMREAWDRNGRPMERDAWVDAMRTYLALPPRVWRSVYNRTGGMIPYDGSVQTYIYEASNGLVW